MKVTAYIRRRGAAKNNLTDMATVYFRIRDGKTDIKAASELTINPNHWSQEQQGYKTRVTLVSDKKRRAFEKSVRELAELIASEYSQGVDGGWPQRLIDRYHHPKIYDSAGVVVDTRLTSVLLDYAKKRGLEKRTVYKFNGFVLKIKRFERWQREYRHRRSYSLDVATMTEHDLAEFRQFCLDEYKLVRDCPSLYAGLGKMHTPSEPLSENGVYDILHRISSVVKWCERNDIPTTRPFRRFELHAPVYSTPWYLTLEERDRIYSLDLEGADDRLRLHRDMFMLQCLIGCRMGDLARLTHDNIVGDAVEYIPRKTKANNPKTVRVPLNTKALAILARHPRKGGTIFPYFTNADYNRSIKNLCTMAGITRMVSVIDVKTREEVSRPANEIASSHLARRTFIGNLYKQVKDPDLIASMTGHVEGSKAFARYRAIDDEMKKELVNMLN